VGTRGRNCNKEHKNNALALALALAVA